MDESRITFRFADEEIFFPLKMMGEQWIYWFIACTD